MRFVPALIFPVSVVAALAIAGAAVPPVSSDSVEVTAHFQTPAPRVKADSRNGTDRPPAVIWLTPLDSSQTPPPDTSRKYTLLQKNKQFTPHVLVVPVG